jgi:DNA polymerase-1
VPPDGAKKNGKGELFLIDGNSLAYRAFFALPEDMATSDGRPTNAIYGFASMMVKILTEHRPAAVIVAWDAGMSGREKQYEPYKAQRKPRPDLLGEQWPHLMPLAEAFGFTNVKVDGYEADDVIAALVRQARERKVPVTVVSGDRDVYQLVGDGVRVMATSRGITETKMYDRDAVIERYGVPPELISDLIGLKGDTSDNIPGVPGVGEKGAAKLLQEFGSLEKVLSSVDQISGPKRKENLTQHADDARVSKQLATLQDEIETGLDIAELMRRPVDRSGLREMAREFELRQVMQRLEEGLPEGDEVPADAGAEALAVEAVEGAVADLAAGPIAVAIGGGRWAAADAENVVTGDASDLGLFAQELAGRPLIAHDAKSLGGGPRKCLLAECGDEGLDLHHDTMVAAYLINPARRVYDLVELAEDEGLAASSAMAPSDAGNEEDGQLEISEAAPADPAAEARLVYELAGKQRARLEELDLMRLLNEVEMPLVEVLAAMERVGVKLDVKRLAEIGAGLEEQISQLQKDIWKLGGEEFTIGSPKELQRILFENLGLTRKRRGKTGYSTDARVLGQIRDEHEIVPKIESWRELTKLKNTYLDSLPGLVDPETKRIHTTFNQVATTTGRLSSTNPNLQNIPIRSDVGRPIRSCFVAERGLRLLSADYSQVELRVLAHVADETALKEIFRAGEDVHRATAAEVFQIEPDDVGVAERSKAKMVNFGIVYGLTGFGLADRLGIDRREAEAFITRYMARFPAVSEFIDRTIEQAREEGYVTTLMGRRRRIPELRSPQPQTESLGRRLAVNTVIQGTAADIIKVAMVRCHDALAEKGMRTRLVLQIHDELLFEGPTDEMDSATALVEKEMCGAFELDPPLEVDAGVGKDWLSAK